ncbi:MAG: nucleotidyltransferase domain-containing protein [Gemmatimonadaceae bacterium]|nr:nucleotidyltransferase domain-containing protein [Gemmatimonadaceae bacterium]
MAMTLNELVSQLRNAYGSTLQSVILYGSAVAGEHIAKKSDYNVLVILDAVPLDRLAAVGAVLRAWADGGNPPPMTFTSAEWKSSSDVFPMEYADILERHSVLYGEDATQGITVSRANLRLQVEQQALGKLLHLRRGAMAAGDDSGEQMRLIEASLSAIMVVFRGVVRLHGEVPSQDYSELSADVARKAGFDATPVERAVEHVRGTMKLKRADAGMVLAGYMAGMEALVAYLDRFTA